jgi:hypothetical protein
MNMREGKERLRNTLTIVGGRRMPSMPADPLAHWMDPAWPAFQAGLVERQRELADAGAGGTR